MRLKQRMNLNITNAQKIILRILKKFCKLKNFSTIINLKD